MKKLTEHPLIIGHRGASGYLPEHTLASYELAINLGVDYIEPDIVMSKDGILIARHENEISETTNIAEKPEFAHLKTTKIIDGEIKIGWFTEDLTLAELKTLKAKERIPDLRPQSAKYDDHFPICTLPEIINLVASKNQELGKIDKNIGICIEVKHPSYFASIGLSLLEPLLTTLSNIKNTHLPIIIECFEMSFLQSLKNLSQITEITNFPLVQLINDIGKPYDFIVNHDSRTYQDLITPQELTKISNYAQGISVHKNLVVPRDIHGKLLTPTSLINDAHNLNLQVYSWTFRNENVFLPLDFQNQPKLEYKLFFELGIDGVFTDFPDYVI
ncbi:glycerophosphodiester phosphodiesterase [Anabaena sp. FACHB-1237]|uniref:glycerophosphodiester phosphodiesterase n=1 Tax=Anabaena sp. FACHB-1237 TaxID=2692769 RepID=UPI001680AE78|nr:glycerophosphodiester phosphodiesterase [Anabaena sp. FACHB-1237]MBD2139213.1 glycerophosphodiester phosphodiesterase [Anabaena sp. FACHB-1237]